MSYLRSVVGLSFFMALCFWQPAWAKEIYTFIGKDGVVHLTDNPDDSRYRPVRLGKRPAKSSLEKRWPVVRMPVVGQKRQKKGVVMLKSRAGKKVADSRVLGKTSRHGFLSMQHSWDSLAWQGNLSQPKPKRRQSQFSPIIREAALRNGLNSALLHSVIRAESGFNPNAKSPKGAVGLMQLMPATARMYGVMDSTDPEANIHGGARFLAALLKRFDNDLKLSLAAYNAGPSTVARYGRAVPPYPETQKYVSRVLRYYQEYRQTM